MAFIRSQERMVYQTVMDHLQTQLTALGWLGTDPNALPFGATVPLTWLEATPDPKLTAMAPNTVAFSEGDLPDDTEAELGASLGGLWTVNHTFFVDIYGESQGIAKALTADIRGILNGRLANRYQPMMDYSQTPVVEAPGHLLHFESVDVARPLNQPSQLRWEVVKATCVHEFNATG